MMHHEDTAPHSTRGYYTNSQQPNPQQSRRQRRYGAAVGGASCEGGTVRMCPHCGRTFKRTEHLERHVRTHTKEKPFVCHCGAAFARRDLLTRHQRISSHDGDSPTDKPPAADAAVAAVASPPGWSADPWAGQQLQLSHAKATQDLPNSRPQADGVGAEAYNESMLSTQLFASDGAGIVSSAGATHDATTHVLGDMDFDPHFREFANFLDGVGLPAEWSPYFNGPPDRDEEVVEDSEPRHSPDATDSPRPDPRQRPGTPFSSWLPSAPSVNAIATYSPDSRAPAVDAEVQRFKTTDEQRAQLILSLDHFSDVLDEDFRFPSRHALTRYITSWFEGFHSHMPFIHCRTWNITDHPIELILSMAAVGAQYCFEHRSSERLFFAGKAILLRRMAAMADKFAPRTSSSLAPMSPNSRRSTKAHAASLAIDPVESIRTLIALMGFATWEPKPEMVREAFTLQGLLAQLLRDIGLDEDNTGNKLPEEVRSSSNSRRDNVQTAWVAWVAEESRRRSKLIAFSFLHTHSVAYNVYPVLRSNEIKLRLPCSTKEWKAVTASSWLAATREVKKQQLYVLDALSLLLKNNNSSSSCAPLDPIPTPLGNYLLLHGLLQRIHIVRDLSLPVMGDSAELPAEEVTKLENGLRSWTAGWQQAAESSLDPNNENGPIPFTSSSLLALAYVRIHLHLGPYRQLETRDPARIARAISKSPNVERSDGVIAALLYAVHMLSIPVRLGVDRVARSQAFFWSVRHSLASLECSILLSKWLSRLADTMVTSPLSDSEDRILHWVRSVVEEAYAVVDFEDEAGFSTDFRDPRKLGIAILRVWAHFFKSNAQWPFINILGRSLEQYRDMLQRDNETLGDA